MKTKRMLVPIDLTKPEKSFKGFLSPNVDAEKKVSFLEISSGKKWEVGRIVFVGIEISKNDVFAKIVDSGKKIESVNVLLDHIENFLQQLTTYKIGDIIGIKPRRGGFELIKLKKLPRAKSKLP